MTAHISKTVSDFFSAMRLIRSICRSVYKAFYCCSSQRLFCRVLTTQCDARGTTCSTTLLAVVRPPCRCSDSFQCWEIRSHDRGSRFPGRCCLHMEQPTVVCHVSDVTVDFQEILKDVLVCDFVLMALTSTPLPVLPYLPNMSPFSLFLFIAYP